jgi:hypothetical protein
MKDDVTLSKSDEGKKVINARGDDIGRVVEIRGGTAYVDPDPGLTDTIMSTLGWGDRDEDTYPLDSSNVEAVTEDEVRVKT